ncbi:hypothetical protein E4U41_002552, partial [Claviceps citrina]
PLLRAYADLLLDRPQTRARTGGGGGGEIDAVKWMTAAAFDIIGDLTFSESFSSLQNNTVHPWVGAIPDAIRLASIRRLYEHFPVLRAMLSRLVSSSFGKAHDPVRNHTKERSAARCRAGEAGPEGRTDFTTYMLRRTRDGADGMPLDEIMATSPNIILAGSETIASVLSGLWFYLAKNPRAYDRLTDEIRRSFHRQDDISSQAAARLDYLAAAINEILRMYPPTPEIPARISPGAFVEGVYLPPGTLVSTYLWATFRSPKYFADPDSFAPERWLPASHPFHDPRFDTDNRDIFKPFSVGPRNCIGKNLALNELRHLISRVLHKFDFELIEGQEDWHDKQNAYIVWSKGPLWLRLSEREVVA